MGVDDIGLPRRAPQPGVAARRRAQRVERRLAGAQGRALVAPAVAQRAGQLVDVQLAPAAAVGQQVQGRARQEPLPPTATAAP
jgi:hypothetical protein